METPTPLALGVLASGEGSNFVAIAERINRRELLAQIRVVIYNNPDAGVAHHAQSFGIPAVLLNHRTFPNRESLDAAIVQVLRDHGVDWVVMAGWMRLVTPTLIDSFPNRILNIHPSLLPSFKGAHAIEQALDYGVQVTGCTVHLVEAAMDSGVILAQRVVQIEDEDTPESLRARIQIEEHRVFSEVLQQLALGKLRITGRRAKKTPHS